jgi:hypothetical protein
MRAQSASPSDVHVQELFRSVNECIRARRNAAGATRARPESLAA